MQCDKNVTDKNVEKLGKYLNIIWIYFTSLWQQPYMYILAARFSKM